MAVAQELVADVERLLEEVESLADPVARQTATGVVEALLDLYGGGLERMVELVAASAAAEELAREFAEDDLVAHLLLLHGLHPVPVRERVLDALGEVRPYLESHGGDVSLLAVEGSTVRLALRGSCSGCPSSTMTLKLAIENAIQKAAPEIADVVAVEPPGGGSIAGSPGGEPAASPLLQIEIASPRASSPEVTGEWTTIGMVNGDGLTTRTVGGAPLLLMRVAERLYGYRSHCPDCEQPLDGGLLVGTELVCATCASRFDVLRAGRCLDQPHLHLEPVPLLEGEDGLVRVAVPVTV